MKLTSAIIAVIPALTYANPRRFDFLLKEGNHPALARAAKAHHHHPAKPEDAEEHTTWDSKDQAQWEALERKFMHSGGHRNIEELYSTANQHKHAHDGFNTYLQALNGL